MNLPEFYADPVSQMQVQAYGSSTREVHMFSTKCKHSEINASAITYPASQNAGFHYLTLMRGAGLHVCKIIQEKNDCTCTS